MLRLLPITLCLTAAAIAHAQTPLQTFMKRYDAAQSVVGIEDVQANPYVYAGQNQLLRLQFVRMAGIAGAIFAGVTAKDGKVTIYLTKVPPKAFSGGERILAAVRVIGYEEDSPFPQIELVGFEICKSANCEEFDR